MWGLVVNRSRDFARQGLGYIPDSQPELQNMLCRWIMAYSRSLMCHLRPGENLEAELKDILPEHEIKALLASAHRPNYVCQVITAVLKEAQLPGSNPNIRDSGAVVPAGAAYRMDEQLTVFAVSAGCALRPLASHHACVACLPCRPALPCQSAVLDSSQPPDPTQRCTTAPGCHRRLRAHPAHPHPPLLHPVSLPASLEVSSWGRLCLLPPLEQQCPKLICPSFPPSLPARSHTSRFMMIWLTLLPFTLWDSCRWGMFPIAFIVAFLLLGEHCCWQHVHALLPLWQPWLCTSGPIRPHPCTSP